jgi:hypothetical protein
MSKSSEAAYAEGASSSSKDEIIRGLNEDLAREYKAIEFSKQCKKCSKILFGSDM